MERSAECHGGWRELSSEVHIQAAEVGNVFERRSECCRHGTTGTGAGAHKQMPNGIPWGANRGERIEKVSQSGRRTGQDLCCFFINLDSLLKDLSDNRF